MFDDNLIILVIISYGALVVCYFGLVAIESVAYANEETRKHFLSKKFNYKFLLLNYTIAALIPITSVFLASICSHYGIGLFNIIEVSLLWQLIIWFIFHDFAFYVAHYIAHYSRFWEFHKLHHSEKHMNTTSAFRLHPIDFNYINSMVWISILIIGPSVVTFLIFYPIMMIIAFFSHSNIYIPAKLDIILSKVIVTPRYHYIHHSRGSMGKNLGNNLTIWDALFNTQIKPSVNKPIKSYAFGFQSQPEEESVSAAIYRPFMKFSRSGQILIGFLIISIIVTSCFFIYL